MVRLRLCVFWGVPAQPFFVLICFAIDVKDEGIGIPESDLPHIFKRFHRAQNSSESSGTGLGLSVVALLVSAMGGKVNVQSKEGEGSCFSVILPKPPTTLIAKP